MTIATGHFATWAIAALATSGVVLRPWKVPEAVWAMAGASALVIFGLLPAADAWQAVGKGTDVYLFLLGMMLIAELARRQGLFDFIAAAAVQQAKASASRLFLLVYVIGTVVTVAMSNDATAVVLTPAVYTVAKKAGAKPLPYLFACAMIANAASFVLPISNPANLVVFGSHPPQLLEWIKHFGLPSLVSIAATFFVLRFLYRKPLAASVAVVEATSALSDTGKVVAWGIAGVAAVLLVASALDIQLGLPTFVAAACVAVAVFAKGKQSPWPTLSGISWNVLLLVAGLFVLVEGLQMTGIAAALAEVLRQATAESESVAAMAAGVGVGLVCNLVNNLPAGLLAGSVLTLAQAAPLVRSAVMIGVDLGPNLSVTGSLATILWLIAIRREGESVSAWQFLKVGAVAMPAALLAALAVLLL
jgi:arsenical pump membrane protein